MGSLALEGTVRIPVGGPVQPGDGSGDRPRVPRREPAGRRRQGCALLFHVRSKVLLDGVDAADTTGRDGREVGRVQKERRDLREAVEAGVQTRLRQVSQDPEAGAWNESS